MQRTRIKICGITRPQDARAAVTAGVDAIGLVFFAGSPRHVTVEQAREICAATAPFVTVVGLFVDPAPAEVEAVLGQVPLDLLQFHGQERNEDCTRYGLPFIKTIAMRADVDLHAAMSGFPDARGFLLDTWQPRTHGGGGKAFDWGRVPPGLPGPYILAGGLDPGNVGEAVRRLGPYAVDVSSGVESAPGIKSAAKIAAFVNGVNTRETDTGN